MAIYILYLLKVSICLSIFFAFYLLLLRKKPFFQFNRLYILYAGVLSFIIPMLVVQESAISEKARTQPTATHLSPPEVASLEWEHIVMQPLQSAPFQWTLTLGDLLFGIYFIGVIVLLFRFIKNIWRIAVMVRESKQHKIFGTKVLQHPSMPTSTFFNILFWRDQTSYSPEQTKAVLLHEKVHARQWHSSDVLIMKLIEIFQWFNPISKYLSRELSLQHEYIADRYAARKMDNKKDYVHLLLEQIPVRNKLMPLNYFHSFTKKRIDMMQQEVPSFTSLFPYFFILPLSLQLAGTFSDSNEMTAVENSIHILSNKEIGLTQNLTPNQSENVIQWGDLVIDLVEIDGWDGVKAFTARKSILKSDLLSLVNENLFIKIGNKKDFDEKTVAFRIIVNSRDTSFHYRNQVGSSYPFRLNSQMAHFLEEYINDGSGFRLQADLEDASIHLFLRITDLKTKTSYLSWNDRKFHVWTEGRLTLPFYPPEINLIEAKEMIRFLRSDEVKLVLDKNELDRSKVRQFYECTGPSRAINKYHLIQRLEVADEISAPIVVAMAGPEGEVYYSAFDDEKKPTIEYETLNDFSQEAFSGIPANHIVNESVLFKWGPFESKLKMNDFQPRFYPLPYSRKNPTMNGQDIADGAPKEMVSQMLKSIPEIQVNGKAAKGKAVIKVHFIDHELLPFYCNIEYDLTEHKLIQSPCQQRILDNIKADDWITIMGVFVESEQKISYTKMKITE